MKSLKGVGVQYKNRLLRHDFSDNFVIAASTIIFLPFVLYLRLVGGTWLTSNHHYPSLLQSYLLTAIFVCFWIFLKWLRKDRYLNSWIVVSLLPFLVVLFVSTLLSRNIVLSSEKAFGVGVFLIFAVIIADIKGNKNLWDGLVNSLLITVLITTLISTFTILYTFLIYQYTLIDIFTRFGTVVRSMPRMPNILNLHNTISAGYYLMVFPLAIYRWGTVKKIGIKIFIATGIVLSAFVFFLIQSRGSLVGLFGMAVCFIFLERRKIKTYLKRNPKRSMVLGSIGLAVFVLGAGYIIQMRGFSLQEKNLMCRFQAWQISAELIKENPIFGSGMETFGQEFHIRRNPEKCSSILHVTHNEFLQILVNFGLAGLISLVLFAGQYWGRVFKDRERVKDIRRYGLVGLAVLVSMGLVTTLLYSPNIRFLTIFYLAWMLPEEEVLENRKEGWVKGFVVIFAFLMAAGWAWTIWKIYPYYQSRMAVNDRDWDLASEWLTEALSREPDFPYYQQALAFVESQDYCVYEKGSERSIALYEQSLTVNGGSAADHANLASLWASEGQYEKAIIEMERAIQLDTKTSRYYCVLGGYFHINGEDQNALIALSDCLVSDQNWLDTPFWEQLELSSEFQEKAVNLSLDKIRINGNENQKLQTARLLYYWGRSREAKKYLEDYISEEGVNYPAYYYLARITLENEQITEAEEYIERALDMNPKCLDCWLLMAEIALENGDLVKTEKCLDISKYLGGNPQLQLLSAKVNLLRGDENAAIESLRSLAHVNVPADLNSHWIASRWHFESSHLSCLPLGLTHHGYYDPVDEGAELLEGLSCEDLESYYDSAVKYDLISRSYFSDGAYFRDCTD